MADKTEPKAEKSDETTEKAEKTGGGMKKLVLLVLIVLVVAAGSLIVGKVMFRGAGKHGKREAPRKAEVASTMALEEFLVNLADDGHYMKVNISLGLKQGVTEEKLQEHVAPIRDAIVSVLCGMHVRSVGTDEGKEHLKKLLVERINKSVPDAPVLEIYFTAFTTQ
jgi:flagellar protein FliL